MILKTTDGGNIWIETYSLLNMSFYDICFTSINTGTVVGGGWNGTNEEGIILQTTDGGNHWGSCNNDLIGSFQGVDFIDVNNGVAVGNEYKNANYSISYGTILKTTDGGISWTILRTINGGVTSINEKQIGKLPDGYLLEQNYPNPFNPTTKIKFAIPKSSFINLKIYDILGREVATLINEDKPSGTYEETWNTANVSSGVYFYQLKSGNYIQTKKMILFK